MTEESVGLFQLNLFTHVLSYMPIISFPLPNMSFSLPIISFPLPNMSFTATIMSFPLHNMSFSPPVMNFLYLA